MTHTIRIYSKSALIGVAAALLCVVAMGQLSVSSTPTNVQQFVPGKGIGNPHPRDMVQFTSTTSPSSPVLVPAGGELELYVVPNGRWLVLLNNGGSDATGVGLYSSGSGIGGGYLGLFEDAGGLVSFKARDEATGTSVAGDSAGPVGGLIGWTFKPGSRVLLKSLHPSDELTVRYNLFGYLVDA